MSDLEPKRLQVLVDGLSQFSPLFLGAVNWNVIDVQLQDIELIEVVRGTNSALYGSNALLGIINVLTRHAAVTTGVDERSGNPLNPEDSDWLYPRRWLSLTMAV